MKAPTWKYVPGLVFAGIIVNAAQSWYRGFHFSWGQELFFVMLFTGAGVFAQAAVARIIGDDPRLRVEPAGPGIARVFVNEVEVGALPSTQYDEIVAEAWRSKWLYARQAINVVASLFRFGAQVLFMIPWLWFAFGALAVASYPDAVSAALTRLVQLRPEQVTQAARDYLAASAVFSFAACAVGGVLASQTYGLFSPFDRQIARRVRELLEVPAEGGVRVMVSQPVSNVRQ